MSRNLHINCLTEESLFFVETPHLMLYQVIRNAQNGFENSVLDE